MTRQDSKIQDPRPRLSMHTIYSILCAVPLSCTVPDPSPSSYGARTSPRLTSPAARASKYPHPPALPSPATVSAACHVPSSICHRPTARARHLPPTPSTPHHTLHRPRSIYAHVRPSAPHLSPAYFHISPPAYACPHPLLTHLRPHFLLLAHTYAPARTHVHIYIRSHYISHVYTSFAAPRRGAHIRNTYAHTLAPAPARIPWAPSCDIPDARPGPTPEAPTVRTPLHSPFASPFSIVRLSTVLCLLARPFVPFFSLSSRLVSPRFVPFSYCLSSRASGPFGCRWLWSMVNGKL